MQILSYNNIVKIINTYGLLNFLDSTIKRLTYDYSRFNEFHLSNRHAVYSLEGVLELMPCADGEFYTFKYVNGHPKNHQLNKLTVAAIGMLAMQKDGYPLMLCDMTLLTAIRTACMTALVASHAALEKSSVLGLIGTGAQAEFLLYALRRVLPIKRCIYYDTDNFAQEKFRNNISDCDLIEAKSIEDLCSNSDIIISATAAKSKESLILPSWLTPGQLVCGLGGDAPNKTEFSPCIIEQSRVIVEYEPQTRIEGELQNCPNFKNVISVADILSGESKARESNQDIIFYDSVGFALEDFSVLMLLYSIIKESKEYDFSLLPELSNVKNLFGALNV